MIAQFVRHYGDGVFGIEGRSAGWFGFHDVRPSGWMMMLVMTVVGVVVVVGLAGR